MFKKRQLALLLAMVFCFGAFNIEAIPVADDKVDELSMEAVIDAKVDIKPTTESPKIPNDAEPEPPQAKELDLNHIQVIKMPNLEEVKEIIEELEEEIEKEKEEIEIKEHIEEELEKKEDEHKKEEKIIEELKEDIQREKIEIAIKENIQEKLKKEEEEIKEEQKMEKQMGQQISPAEIVVAIQERSVDEPVNKEERSPRSMQMELEEKEVQPTSSLTDDDIDTIMKMISDPKAVEIEIKTENDQIVSFPVKTEKDGEKEKDETEVEPRSTEAKPRVGRAIRNEGKGYYILAFSPVEGPLVPTKYTKIDIIPIERSIDNDLADDFDEVESLKSAADTDIDVDADIDEIEESRLLTRKQFNKYLRKMMRQIRKGTRKIQRKTRLRTAAEEEPTVENFVRKWYDSSKKATAPKSSWFSWGQKTQ